MIKWGRGGRGGGVVFKFSFDFTEHFAKGTLSLKEFYQVINKRRINTR